ncbi:21 kDa seed protein-like [Andrographis paniculata]|uniref:21 kDa seed protein-like n=1 Tax=Andrographis paniculata TaxID=175694 RepID=UPI0021E99773|nr:21 kDa seed protein-like [Andrographis paniculata]
MKTLLLSLCFLFFFAISAAQDQDLRVFDTNGDQLKAGEKYYIVSSIRGAGGGGLFLSNYSAGGCEITVVQSGNDLYRGIPWSFHPPSPEQAFIYVSQSLNVKAANPPASCTNATSWSIGTLDSASGGLLIQLTGTRGFPSCTTYQNWFKIERGRFSDTYKFVFNPVDICSPATENFNLSLAFPSGARTLVLPFDKNTISFDFEFFKAEGSSNKAYVQ